MVAAMPMAWDPPPSRLAITTLPDRDTRPSVDRWSGRTRPGAPAQQRSAPWRRARMGPRQRPAESDGFGNRDSLPDTDQPLLARVRRYRAPPRGVRRDSLGCARRSRSDVSQSGIAELSTSTSGPSKRCTAVTSADRRWRRSDTSAATRSGRRGSVLPFSRTRCWPGRSIASTSSSGTPSKFGKPVLRYDVVVGKYRRACAITGGARRGLVGEHRAHIVVRVAHPRGRRAILA